MDSSDRISPGAETGRLHPIRCRTADICPVQPCGRPPGQSGQHVLFGSCGGLAQPPTVHTGRTEGGTRVALSSKPSAKRLQTPFSQIM
nr:unnamed protein product [Callosobruchus chinensis]